VQYALNGDQSPQCVTENLDDRPTVCTGREECGAQTYVEGTKLIQQHMLEVVPGAITPGRHPSAETCTAELAAVYSDPAVIQGLSTATLQPEQARAFAVIPAEQIFLNMLLMQIEQEIEMLNADMGRATPALETHIIKAMTALLQKSST